MTWQDLIYTMRPKVRAVLTRIVILGFLVENGPTDEGDLTEEMTSVDLDEGDVHDAILDLQAEGLTLERPDYHFRVTAKGKRLYAAITR